MIIDNPTDEQLCELWKHSQSFFHDQRIRSEESVYQSDNVIQNAYEFLEGVGNIIGWYNDE